jgi:hypothetical protein
LAVQLPSAIIRESPAIARALVWDVPRTLANSLWGVFRDLGKEIWNGLMSVFDFGIFSGGGSAKWYNPFSWFSDGGVVGGKASFSGDSKMNDPIPAMLSPGEMVIPRLAMADGLAGVMRFASSMMPKQYANGGVVAMGGSGQFNTNKVYGGSDNSILIEEVKQLRMEVSQMSYAVALNTGETARKLKQWDVIGLPAERD